MTAGRRGRPIMVQGTSSSAGKSTLATALCRIFAQDGLRVAPFKAQNMANNSYVALDGGEMGRAQAVQAAAAGIEPTTDMNPILLKPEADSRSQVVVNGRSIGTFPAREYYARKQELWGNVAAALDRLLEQYDVVVIEGAGSPAEVNLRATDIANMRVALHANAPVLLVGDIDRGGVFASLLGTVELLEPEERALVKGLAINKFRGDRSVLEPLPSMIAERTKIPVVGVVPFIPDLRIKEEDATSLDTHQNGRGDGGLKVSVIRLPRVSNFDDIDPFTRAGISVQFVDRPEQLDGSHLVIVPGTKSTIADLRWMQERRLDDAVRRVAIGGMPVVGICGGLQILGQQLDDPHGVDTGAVDSELGVGLLPVNTSFSTEKTTRRVSFRCDPERGLLAGDGAVEGTGYEIHSGQTSASKGRTPVTILGGESERPDGALAGSGWILGTYIHGFFDSPAVLERIIRNVARKFGLPAPDIHPFSMEAEYDRLADTVRGSLNMRLVYSMLGLEPGQGARR